MRKVGQDTVLFIRLGKRGRLWRVYEATCGGVLRYWLEWEVN